MRLFADANHTKEICPQGSLYGDPIDFSGSVALVISSLITLFVFGRFILMRWTARTKTKLQPYLMVNLVFTPLYAIVMGPVSIVSLLGSASNQYPPPAINSVIQDIHSNRTCTVVASTGYEYTCFPPSSSASYFATNLSQSFLMISWDATVVSAFSVIKGAEALSSGDNIRRKLTIALLVFGVLCSFILTILTIKDIAVGFGGDAPFDTITRVSVVLPCVARLFMAISILISTKNKKLPKLKRLLYLVISSSGAITIFSIYDLLLEYMTFGEDVTSYGYVTADDVYMDCATDGSPFALSVTIGLIVAIFAILTIPLIFDITLDMGAGGASVSTDRKSIVVTATKTTSGKSTDSNAKKSKLAELTTSSKNPESP